MKNSVIAMVIMLLSLCVVSCGGGQNSGKKFNPQDRTTSTMSETERKQAIAKKRAELSVDPYEMMTSNGVKLSVMPPYPAGDIDEKTSEKIAVRMLQMIAQNGIGGLNTVPGFALTATLTDGEKKTTGSAPQKMVAKYTINYAVINTVTGDVYATASQDVTGVGDSFQQATSNAVNEIKNSPAVQQMLSAASEKIIAWFEDNIETFKVQVESAYGQRDYALALSLIESVPQKAGKAFEYAQSRRADVMDKFKKSIATQELAALRQAIQASGNDYSAEVYAHLSLLPQDSPEYKEAQTMLTQYESAVSNKRELEHQQAGAEAARAHEIELANIEAERLKAKYQAKATEQALRQQMRDEDYKERGFWGSLGARTIGAIDNMSDKFNEDKE